MNTIICLADALSPCNSHPDMAILQVQHDAIRKHTRTHMSTHAHSHTHTYTYTYTYSCAHIQAQLLAAIRPHTITQTRRHTSIIFKCTHINSDMPAYVQAQIHTRTCTHTSTHTRLNRRIV